MRLLNEDNIRKRGNKRERMAKASLHIVQITHFKLRRINDAEI